MKITLKHYYDFGRRLNKDLDFSRKQEFWDALRIRDDEENIFSIPNDSFLWEQKCLNNKILDIQSDAIIQMLGSKYRRINSYGVGCAGLEYLIKRKNPQLFLWCSDFAPQAIERLKRNFKEADAIVPFNMLEGQWVHPDSGCAHLFYRVDTEFDDRQWEAIFRKMSQAGLDDILFIPSEILTIKGLFREQVKYFLVKFARHPLTFVGYRRTEEQLKALFYEYYQVEYVRPVGSLKGFFLKRK